MQRWRAKRLCVQRIKRSGKAVAWPCLEAAYGGRAAPAAAVVRFLQKRDACMHGEMMQQQWQRRRRGVGVGGACCFRWSSRAHMQAGGQEEGERVSFCIWRMASDAKAVVWGCVDKVGTGRLA